MEKTPDFYFSIFFACARVARKSSRYTLILSPYEPILMIIVGFVIINNVSTSDIFARYLVPILDSRKSLDDYICQVALENFSSLVYSNNGIKAAQTGGGFSVLQR